LRWDRFIWSINGTNRHLPSSRDPPAGFDVNSVSLSNFNPGGITIPATAAAPSSGGGGGSSLSGGAIAGIVVGGLAVAGMSFAG